MFDYLREAGVLDFSLTQDAIQFRPDQVLQHGSSVVRPRRGALAFNGLPEEIQTMERTPRDASSLSLKGLPAKNARTRSIQ